MAAMLRLGARVLLFALIAALVAEGGLQVASLFARGRATAWREGRVVRVLCIGDSHTFGAGVPPEESYPAQLQQLLDASAPGRFSVMNLGVPGMSSTQVRLRLADDVRRYAPDVVIVWCGVNNKWNNAEVDEVEDAGQGIGERLEALALHSRLYRLVRVWQRDRDLVRNLADVREGGEPQEITSEARPSGAPDAPGATHTIHLGGVDEVVDTRPDPDRAVGDPGARAYSDFKAISAELKRDGIPLILVLYPIDSSGPRNPFHPPNQAMRRVGREDGVAVVDSPRALLRVPRAERDWRAGMHPGPHIYREIARDAEAAVMELRGGAPPEGR
jgi:hypothetical protein